MTADRKFFVVRRAGDRSIDGREAPAVRLVPAPDFRRQILKRGSHFQNSRRLAVVISVQGAIVASHWQLEEYANEPSGSALRRVWSRRWPLQRLAGSSPQFTVDRHHDPKSHERSSPRDVMSPSHEREHSLVGEHCFAARLNEGSTLYFEGLDQRAMRRNTRASGRACPSVRLRLDGWARLSPLTHRGCQFESGFELWRSQSAVEIGVI